MTFARRRVASGSVRRYQAAVDSGRRRQATSGGVRQRQAASDGVRRRQAPSGGTPACVGGWPVSVNGSSLVSGRHRCETSASLSWRPARRCHGYGSRRRWPQPLRAEALLICVAAGGGRAVPCCAVPRRAGPGTALQCWGAGYGRRWVAVFGRLRHH